MVSCGASHMAFVTVKGNVHLLGAWKNDETQEVLFQENNIKDPISLGDNLSLMTASGREHTLIVTVDGKVLSFGHGANGKLGLDLLHDVRIPTAIPKFGTTHKVLMAACGAHHSAAITECGLLWTWGLAWYGRLGHGDEVTRSEPTPVDKAFQGERVTFVACGFEHTACVCEGLLYQCGQGRDGRLGLGDMDNRLAPSVVRGGDLADIEVTQVACGFHTAVVTEDGSLFTFGQGWNGKLGHGDEENKLLPTRVRGALEQREVIMVSVGEGHTAAVCGNGELWMWGYGGNARHGLQADYTKLLVPTRVQGELAKHCFVMVACGELHTAAVTGNGELFTWGHRNTETLHQGETVNQNEREEDKVAPASVQGPVLGNDHLKIHIGCCRGIPPETALAFAMARHRRLGQHSHANLLLSELVQFIVEAAGSWPRRKHLTPGMLIMMSAGHSSFSGSRQRDDVMTWNP